MRKTSVDGRAARSARQLGHVLRRNGVMALVFGAIVPNRWFHTHRGLVTGIFAAANATGQLIFLPVIAYTSNATAGARPR